MQSDRELAKRLREGHQAAIDWKNRQNFFSRSFIKWFVKPEDLLRAAQTIEVLERMSYDPDGSLRSGAERGFAEGGPPKPRVSVTEDRHDPRAFQIFDEDGVNITHEVGPNAARILAKCLRQSNPPGFIARHWRRGDR